MIPFQEIHFVHPIHFLINYFLVRREQKIEKNCKKISTIGSNTTDGSDTKL